MTRTPPSFHAAPTNGRPVRMQRLAWLATAVALTTATSGCGGGSGGSADVRWNDTAAGSALGPVDPAGVALTPPAPTPPAPTPPAPTPPAPTPPESAAACADMALCENFESEAVGAAPNKAMWTVGGTPNCYDGSGKATIVGDVVHSGYKSVRIDPGPNYCGHTFIINTKIASMGSVVYGRFWLRLAQALGDQHVTMMSMRDALTSDSQNDQELRLGGQSGILMWNRSKGDATLPSLSPTGTGLSVKIPAQTWTCVEFGLNADLGTMQTWVNGSSVAGLQMDGVKTPDVDEAWLNSNPSWRPMVSDLKLGWETYGNINNTVWIDDVALHTSRIGCN